MTEQTKTEVAERAGTGRLNWKRVAVWSGWGITFVLAAASGVLGDVEAAITAMAFLVATLLLRWREGMVGAGLLSLVSAVTLAFMFAAAITNARSGSDLGAVALSSGLAALSLVSLASGVGLLAARARETAGHAPQLTVMFGIVLFIGLVGWGAVTGEANDQEGTVQLVSENVAFSPATMSVAAGEVAVELTNKDLFWHTFTIEELGVDLRVPVGASFSVAFDAPPGEYEFFCAIPGHMEAGMVGTLIVAQP